MRSAEAERNEQGCGREVTFMTNRLWSVRGTAMTPSGKGAARRLRVEGQLLPMRVRKLSSFGQNASLITCPRPSLRMMAAGLPLTISWSLSNTAMAFVSGQLNLKILHVAVKTDRGAAAHRTIAPVHKELLFIALVW